MLATLPTLPPHLQMSNNNLLRQLPLAYLCHGNFDAVFFFLVACGRFVARMLDTLLQKAVRVQGVPRVACDFRVQCSCSYIPVRSAAFLVACVQVLRRVVFCFFKHVYVFR